MRYKIVFLAAVLSISACQNSLINQNIMMAKPGSLSFIHDLDSSYEMPSFSSNSPSSSTFSFSIEKPSTFSKPTYSSRPASSSSSSSSSGAPLNQDYFYCPSYGPFPINSDDFDASFTYSLFSIDSQNIIERLRILNTSETVMAATSKARKYYTSGTTTVVVFTIPLHDYWTVNGLTINFEIINASNYTILKGYSITIYPPSCQNISAQQLKSDIYVSKNLGFYGNSDGFQPIKETIDFTHFGDYLDVNSYYKLDLSRNSFIYSGNNVPTSYELLLQFNDSEYLFPYCYHDDYDDIYFDLTMTINNGAVSFKIASTLYVNKRTLQISSTYRHGFIITHNLYLPINGKSKFNGKTLYIHIINLGMDSISTVYPVKYDVTKNLVGTCSDGDYCVGGGGR